MATHYLNRAELNVLSKEPKEREMMIDLLDAIYRIARDSIKESNRGNPFISKSEAFKFWNDVR